METGLISCLLYRAKSVCSSQFYFNAEIANLRKLFSRNSYPISFFNRVLQRFLDKQLVSESNNSDSESDKLGVTFVVPFIGEASIKFSKQVSLLIKNTFNVEVLPVFKSSKVGDYFSLKSTTPFPYSSNVVYKFSCLRDADRSYIGQTKRHLVTRVSEHVELHKADPKSEIKSHIYNCAACHSCFLGVDNFEILKRCRNNYDTKICEALRIKQFKPKLNKQLLTKGSSYFLKVF